EAVAGLAEVERSAHERDPPAALREQVLDGEAAAGLVVDRDGAERGIRAVPVDEHGRDAALPQAVQASRDVPVRRDQYPRHPLLLEQVEVGGLARDILVA